MSNNEDKKKVEKVTVETVKEQNNKAQDDIVTLTSGIRVRLRPVAASLIRDVQNKIKEPLVPMMRHPNASEDEDRFIENPNSPEYLEELRDVQILKEEASTNVMILMGIELLDDIPDKASWLPKLVYLGAVEEREDVDDMTLELWYKKYIVADAFVFSELAKKSGVTEELIAQATENFQRNEK